MTDSPHPHEHAPDHDGHRHRESAHTAESPGHTEAHAHGHGGNDSHGHSHSHAISADADRTWLRVALGLILALMAVQVTAGTWANSLALMPDAAHLLTDAGALLLSLITLRIAARPAAGRATFGMRRAEVVSGHVNGATLLVFGLLIAWHGVQRLISPDNVAGGTVAIVAAIGIVVNLLAAVALSRANRESLNVEGSFQHILTDLYAFIGTFIAGLIIYFTGFDRADAIASLAVAALMVWSAYGLLSETVRLFLGVAPRNVDPDAIGNRLAAVTHVVNVHDLHVWDHVPGSLMLSAHVLVEPGCDCHAARWELEQLLQREYGIEHTTLQVDHVSKQFLTVDSTPPSVLGRKGDA
ncbi:MAG: cation diffusion facilitator family transporter [Thermoleophilia bacterium]|nr:cation diffusion facilitator family transporter [Thermoleophilia bacterium]